MPRQVQPCANASACRSAAAPDPAAGDRPAPRRRPPNSARTRARSRRGPARATTKRASSPRSIASATTAGAPAPQAEPRSTAARRPRGRSRPRRGRGLVAGANRRGRGGPGQAARGRMPAPGVARRHVKARGKDQASVGNAATMRNRASALPCCAAGSRTAPASRDAAPRRAPGRWRHGVSTAQPGQFQPRSPNGNGRAPQCRMGRRGPSRTARNAIRTHRAATRAAIKMQASPRKQGPSAERERSARGMAAQTDKPRRLAR